MFAIFLPSLNFRGNRSPYLWWLYKFISELDGEDLGIIAGEEYFLAPEIHLKNGRPEVDEFFPRRLGYKIPSRAKIDSLLRANISIDTWLALEDLFPANPNEAFRHFCLYENDLLYSGLSDSLSFFKNVNKHVEAVFTCVNCMTLKRVCAERGVPVVHFEMGPLRSPAYLPTAYFDFSGVNGNSESSLRYSKLRKNQSLLGKFDTVESLHSLFLMRRPNEAEEIEAEIGIGLQVEDDSNIVCYSNGFSSSSLINHARQLIEQNTVKEPILIRSHPGSFFSLRDLPKGLLVDSSPSSIEFILKCARIHTINSSVAVEAMLMAREVEIYGESPFSFCIDQDNHAPIQDAFAFFMLNCLVPWRLVFSGKYIRWRLSMPDEEDIKQAHLQFHVREKIQVLQLKVEELEALLKVKEDEVRHFQKEIKKMRFGLLGRLAFKIRDILRSLLK